MIQLPTKKRAPLSQNPTSLLIYSLPKQGKTTITAGLEDALLVTLGPESAEKLEACDVRINTGNVLDDIFQFAELMDSIREANKVAGGFAYKYGVLDSLTVLDEWSEVAGTIVYESTKQGKKWNAKDGIDNTRGIYEYGDPEWTPVTQMGEGYGYRWTRQWVLDKLKQFETLFPTVIYLCHVKDKYVATKSGDKVQTMDLSMTGALKGIVASRMDAIGYFYRKDKQGILSFKADKDRVAGNRTPHLQDDIVISEQKDGKVVTYWDKIFVPTMTVNAV